MVAPWVPNVLVPRPTATEQQQRWANTATRWVFVGDERLIGTADCHGGQHHGRALSHTPREMWDLSALSREGGTTSAEGCTGSSGADVLPPPKYQPPPPPPPPCTHVSGGYGKPPATGTRCSVPNELHPAHESVESSSTGSCLRWCLVRRCTACSPFLTTCGAADRVRSAVRKVHVV